MDTNRGGYGRLLCMTAFHFVLMYFFMYVMVNTFANVYPSLNQLYMAALMASPMPLLELWLMGSMYPKKKLNVFLVVTSILLLAGSFLFIRQQVAITDEQFLKSMIPHHAGAILMCEQSSLKDPQIKELCENIISGQQAEINWMNTKLDSLKQ